MYVDPALARNNAGADASAGSATRPIGTADAAHSCSIGWSVIGVATAP